LYISAYRAGNLHPRLLDTMNTGTFWCKMFLENPDLECVNISLARPLQQMCYALLDDGLGLPERPDEPEDEDDSSQVDGEESPDDEGDDDELVDVVEDSDDEDPLAPLRGALQQLDGDETPSDRATDATPSVSSRTVPRTSKAKTIVEYVRRGTRLAAEEVTVPTLTDVLLHVGGIEDNGTPVQLWPEEDRFTLFLRAVAKSDIPSVQDLPPQDMLIVLTLRWVVSRLHARMEESGGNMNRLKEKWTKLEARALFASFLPPSAASTEDLPPVSDRNVQMVSQVLTAAEAIERLQQILLLSENYPTPVLRFSGKAFHSYLTAPQSIPASAVSPKIWAACMDGLEHCFSEIIIKKKKERNREQAGINTPKAKLGPTNGLTSKSRKPVASSGMYSVLSSLNA